jgi:serine protease Do
MGVYSAGENSLGIRQVIPNTPASAAGLRDGDEFVQVGNLKPHTFEDIRQMVGSLRPGTRIEIVFRRGSKVQSTTLVLMSKPDDFDRMQLIDPLP